MPPDAVRLRAQLAQHLDALYRLQVVEAAEDMVRRCHLLLLSSQLEELQEELVQAQRHLATARNGNELSLIIEAEELVCEILRQTTILQRHAGEHIRACNRTHSVYLAQRDRLVDRIDQLRRRWYKFAAEALSSRFPKRT